jgi:hypothetical protein
MPLRPMHVLDPEYPQLPVEFDWGTLPQDLDNNRQLASLSATDISPWISSQMPSSSTRYSQTDQQQTYSDTTSHSRWLDQLYNDTASWNSTSIPFTFPDDWSSQPQIRGYSAHAKASSQLMDIRRAARGSPQINQSTGEIWCVN